MSTRIKRSMTLAHGLLASLPLGVLGWVVWRLYQDPCNHLGFSPLAIAQGLLLTLCAVEAIRWVVVRVLPWSVFLRMAPAILAVLVTYSLDRCNLLIGYRDFTERHLPDPDPTCCDRLGSLPACRAANATRVPAAIEQSPLPDMGAPADAGTALEHDAAEARRDDQQRRWQLGMKERLIALREQGGGFAEVGPLAEEERLRAKGEVRINGCSPKLDQVTVLPTPSGWFVPAATQDFAVCGFNLWFVPSDKAGEPTMLEGNYEEFDLAFTTRMVASDFDADGVVEAVLVRGWQHPEGVGDGRQVLVLKSGGDVRRTPFTDVEDVDSDGRLDVVVDFSVTHNGRSCDEGEVWYAESLTAPTIVLHAIGGARFSMTDEVARDRRAATCLNDGPLRGALTAGKLNEVDLARRLLCRLANNESREVLEEELERICHLEYSVPEDCARLRPGVCRFRTEMRGWFKAFAELEAYL